MFVSDFVVSVRLSTGSWRFFKRPLLMGDEAENIKVNSNGIQFDPSILSSELRPTYD